jgi:uncharacterized membrane protein YcaP (DUF421 family)
MKAEDIFLDDWNRILIGEVPVLFLVEAIVRNVMIFIILMVSLRQMGQRMASQLGRNEMVSITALAAAVGVALQSPDRGLLATIIIAIIVVLIQQFIAKFTTKSETFEQLTQDSVSTLVEDGRLILKNMKTTRLTRERIFSQLRYKGLRHLGEVQRMYLEANGSFTILATKGPKPGLCILPGWDESFIKKVCVETESMVCQNCGTIQKPVSQECQQCGSTSYTKGVL